MLPTRTAILVIATAIQAPAALAAGASAEYALRWPAEGSSIKDGKAVLQALKLKSDDRDKYEVQYFDLTPPADAPPGATSILRQRKKGKDKYELSFKYRSDAPITTPALKAWACPLPGAAESKDELDVSFSAGTQAVQLYSRSCSVEARKAAPLPPAGLAAKPRGCISRFTRHTTGHTTGRLKIEEWTLANGERLIEVSRSEKDSPDARARFQRDIVEPLLRAGVAPTGRSKTELGGSCD
ncbi:MAG: hypothetical protein REI94_11260 [Moraxellaceae bacterium]|nr:hypothetical protein [Moraxellaceae bacterium]